MFKMPSIDKSVWVHYSPAQMYALVTDVPSYPQFLPWCGGAQILESAPGRVVAMVRIDFKGIKQSFTTENLLTENQLLEVRLKDGPFKSLQGVWRFTPLGADGQACKVQFQLSYEFSNRLLAAVVGPVFSHITSTFIDSFCQRAEAVYGVR